MNDLFIRACRRKPVERTPIWLMRQAGRYLPGYMKVREKYDFVSLTREPEQVVKVTLEPVERFGMDASILFADILTPLIGAGVDVEFAPGPVVAKPFRTVADLERLSNFVPEAMVPETLESIRLLVQALDVPLIGFAGAPFTLACYLVDGKGTKDFARTRTMMFKEPDLMRLLLESLGTMVTDYLVAQVANGAKAVQVFDTWAGLLAAEDFREFEAPVLAKMFRRVRALGVPVIYYLNGCASLLTEIGELGADVAGIDWRVPLDRARAALPEKMAVQGNLDPLVLLAPHDVIRDRAKDVLRRAGDRPGHIFNLGHGIHRDTSPDSVKVLVDTVHEESEK